MGHFAKPPESARAHDRAGLSPPRELFEHEVGTRTRARRRPGSLKSGTLLGEFELVELIGRGGFGEVYRARQPRWDRDVAIKVVFPRRMSGSEASPAREGAGLRHRLGLWDQSTNKIAERFLSEVELVRSLSHPNIVTVHDFGRTDDDVLWMAMELVLGPTLARVLQFESPLTPRRARRITLWILSGLVEAHSQNIVHRDLKPANIMLTSKGPHTDWVKILDFGIAEAMAGNEDDEPSIQSRYAAQLSLGNHGVTAAGFGTPRYMAPEQIRLQPARPYSDVYSVGLMFFEMLTGRRAVGGSNTEEVLANQLDVTPALPPWLGEDPLGSVILKAVQKDPALRYPSALEFYTALDDLADQTSDVGPILAELLGSARSPGYVDALCEQTPSGLRPDTGPGAQGDGKAPQLDVGHLNDWWCQTHPDSPTALSQVIRLDALEPPPTPQAKAPPPPPPQASPRGAVGRPTARLEAKPQSPRRPASEPSRNREASDDFLPGPGDQTVADWLKHAPRPARRLVTAIVVAAFATMILSLLVAVRLSERALAPSPPQSAGSDALEAAGPDPTQPAVSPVLAQSVDTTLETTDGATQGGTAQTPDGSPGFLFPDAPDVLDFTPASGALANGLMEAFSSATFGAATGAGAGAQWHPKRGEDNTDPLLVLPRSQLTTVEVHTDGASAKVYVAGDILCTHTPCVFVARRSKEPLTVELVRRGYETALREVDLDRPMSAIYVKMRRLRGR